MMLNVADRLTNNDYTLRSKTMQKSLNDKDLMLAVAQLDCVLLCTC